MVQVKKSQTWRRLAVGSTAGLCLGVLGVVAYAPLQAQHVVEKSTNALSDFLGRSPGQRSKISSLKGKARGHPVIANTPAAAGGPAERALGKVFEPGPGIPLDTLPTDPLASPAVMPTIPATGAAPAGFNGPLLGIPGDSVPSSSSSSGGGTSPPGGTSSSGGSSSGGAPVVPTVPEPSAWVLLLTGLFTIGGSLRRRRLGEGSAAAV